MKKIYWVLLLSVTVFFGCKKDNFFDKFPPEIMFFEGTNVENANFITKTLPQGTVSYTLKARISSPFGLKEIQVHSIVGTNETLLNTITEFGNKPNEFFLNQNITGISGNTEIKYSATDKDGRNTVKIFKIICN